MTRRRALRDPDFDSAFDDPDNGWFGHVQADDPMLSRDPAAISTEDTDRWPVLTVNTSPAPDVDDVPSASARPPPVGSAGGHLVERCRHAAQWSGRCSGFGVVGVTAVA